MNIYEPSKEELLLLELIKYIQSLLLRLYSSISDPCLIAKQIRLAKKSKTSKESYEYYLYKVCSYYIKYRNFLSHENEFRLDGNELVKICFYLRKAILGIEADCKLRLGSENRKFEYIENLILYIGNE